MNMATRWKRGYERRKRWSANAVRRKAEIKQERHVAQMRLLDEEVRDAPRVLHARQSIVAFTSTGQTVRIVGFLLRELSDGSLWLENEIGEGMQMQPGLLEPCLRRIMKKHL